MPPRPASGDGSQPQQWFVLRPWLFDVTAATSLLRRIPRPAQPLPVMAWARAYGLIPGPGSSPQSLPLIGLGSGFDPGYAMTTDLDDPVIIASITAVGAGPSAPLLTTDAPVQGPGPAASTCPPSCSPLRRPCPSAARRPSPPRPRPRPAASPQKGKPAMTTITIWHNAAVDGQGRHTAILDGYQPSDPMVRVFTYQADPAAGPEEIAEEAFVICNGHPRDARGTDLARRYHERELRSLSKGDVVVAGEVALAVAGVGWIPVRGSLHEVRTDEYGTHPLRPPSPVCSDETGPGQRPQEGTAL